MKLLSYRMLSHYYNAGAVDSLSEPEYSQSMEQLALFDTSQRWTVTSLTRHILQLMEADPDLQDVWVEGEISNLSRPSSGHVYFTLKDSSAALRCVMWKSDAVRLRFTLQEGSAVEAHGKISVYQTAGQYQLYADSLSPLGEGALYQEFLRLKSLLEARGLFDTSRKRLIPEIPKRVGIVTSPTGAALRDMLNTLRRRMPLAEVFLAPTPVQGEEAPPAIVAALMKVNEAISPDVILLGRGGGSIEDLWAFNDERVVLAVTESRAPVISGVGHETDFTLVDFAADLRAPTPTAAAELATPITILDLLQAVSEMHHKLKTSMEAILEHQQNYLENIRTNLFFHSPLMRVQNDRQRLDDLSRRINAIQAHRLEIAGEQVKGINNRLAALNPMAVLRRGYAVVTKQDRIVASRTQVQPGDDLRVRVQDGEFGASVSETEN
jgi:exodeoxyribonuclease VII large subunit